MADLAYTNVTYKENKPRVWLESFALQTFGFKKGTPYTVEKDTERKVMRLRVDEQGKRKTSGRTQNGIPIIELFNKDVTQTFGLVRKVKIHFAHGLITLIAHPDEKRKAEREASFRANLSKGKLTCGTLCSGIGIATAATSEGIEEHSNVRTHVKWMVDMSGRFLSIARAQNPKVSARTNLVAGMMEDIEPEALSQVNILNLSLSCTNHCRQGATKKRLVSAEEDDKAGTSILPMLSILRYSNPALVISENVVEAKNSETYALLRAGLRRLGYRVYDRFLSGRDVNSLELRRRYWFVAVSDGLPEFDIEDLPQIKARYHRVADVLESDSVVSGRWFCKSKYEKREAANAAEGRNFKAAFVKPEDTSIPTIPAGYSRGQMSTPHLEGKDSMIRRFTPIEHARIKEVPEYFIAGLPESIAHYVLGQGVQWLQAKRLGAGIGRWCSTIQHTVVSLTTTRSGRHIDRPARAVPAQMGLAL